MTGTGIHVLDSMIRIGGPVRRLRAQLLSQKPPPDPRDTISIMMEFETGISGLLAAVRCTPMFLRLHVFGRNGSAEVIGRNEMVLRKGSTEPQHVKFPPNDSVRVNLEAFADAVAGVAPYPIAPQQIVDVVAAFEGIAKSATAGGEAIDLHG
jgi:predicted dehydrogenase